MIAINIVGFKKSGKTTFIGMLADIFQERGLTPGIAKFTHHGLDKAGTDTAWLMKPGRTVVGIGPEETAAFWSGPKYLPDLLPLMTADILLVEGGKNLGWLPRIILPKAPLSDEDATALKPELAIATYGDTSIDGLPQFGPESLDKLADLVLQQAFMLPGLDCGECGFTNCAGLAAAIVAGKEAPKQCAARTGTVQITSNGQPLALNTFVEAMVLSVTRGMLQTLKGYTPGSEVEIRLKG